MTDLSRPPRGHVERGGGKPETDVSPSPSPRTGQGQKPGWDGPTYYGRAQLKPAPFNNWIVGGYIFIAGLAGSAALVSGIADALRGRSAEGLVRRGRYLSLLAPVLGAPLLIVDLHTPKRFYNMLRVAKPTSPMSIGTWILMSFSAGSVLSAAGQFLSDLRPRLRWPKAAARAGEIPAAAAGAGLSVYTAALLSATSTPAWAAVPRTLAVRFGASSMAAAASALLLGERDHGTRRALGTLAAGALAVELASGAAQDRAYEHKGVDQAKTGPWGTAEAALATGVGAMLPLGLFALAVAFPGRRGRKLADLAAVCAIAGSAALKISTLGVGDESASRPEISFRFSQPKNLPPPKRARLLNLS